MLYQLSYASRKLLTLAKRKPNCKGFCERDEQTLEGRFCAFLFAYASLSSTWWLDFLSGLSHATRGLRVHRALALNPPPH